ncbi:glycosyltransferase family 39 protein [bacterium]|nr:glycosyltransferase family 39 protein [bacterium]
MNRFTRDHFHQIFLTVIILLLGFLSLRYDDRWSASLAYPFQMDETEGFILLQADAIARGESIYNPIDQPPYLVGNYPPLFQIIYAAVVGSKASLWSLAYGRMLTIAATLLSAIFLAAISFRMTRRILPALLAPLLFLVSYETFQWSAFVRVDMPALAFTLGGLLVFIFSQRRANLIISGLLFTAAAYTRQTAILAPLACTIALLIHDRRRLAYFLVPMLLTAALALIILEWTSHGEFLRHTIAYNANRMDWTGWLRLMQNEIWFFYRWLIVAMLFTLVTLIYLSFIHPIRPISPISPIASTTLNLYAVLAAVSLLSYAKVGAAPNYVLEPLAATAVWLTASLGHLFNYRRPILTELILFILMIHAAWLFRHQRDMFSSPTPRSIDKQAATELAQYLRNTPGELLSEEPFFTMLAGRPVLFDPFIMTQLAREAKWDPTGFIHMLEARRFARIVTCEDLMTPQKDYDRYTQAMAEAVRRHYRPAGRLVLPNLARQYFIYEPAPGNP